MIDLPPPPLSDYALSRLRLHLRKTLPSHGLGPHIRRQQGQSLQFREYRAYQFGDDIRTVDWRASARQGRRDQLIVKTFDAEERMTVTIMVDNRPAMRLPLGAEKLRFAIWAMECMAQIAADDGNDVILAPLFGTAVQKPVKVRGRAVRPAARQFARHLWSDGAIPDIAESPAAAAFALGSLLRPSSAVVVISDLMFADADGSIARLAGMAQRQRRELLVLELDSMEHEIAAIDRVRPARIGSVEGRSFPELPVDLGDALFAGARQTVADLRKSRRAEWSKGGLVWPSSVVWPAPTATFSAAGFFASRFPDIPILRNIVTRKGLG